MNLGIWEFENLRIWGSPDSQRTRFRFLKSPNPQILKSVYDSPMMKRCALPLGMLIVLLPLLSRAQTARGRDDATTTVLRPARVFDGETTHEGWAVRVVG